METKMKTSTANWGIENARNLFHAGVRKALNGNQSVKIGNVTFTDDADGGYMYDLPTAKWDAEAITRDMTEILNRGIK
jgi:hypothetical protein